MRPKTDRPTGAEQSPDRLTGAAQSPAVRCVRREYLGSAMAVVGVDGWSRGDRPAAPNLIRRELPTLSRLVALQRAVVQSGEPSRRLRAPEAGAVSPQPRGERQPQDPASNTTIGTGATATATVKANQESEKSRLNPAARAIPPPSPITRLPGVFRAIATAR